MFGQTAAAAVAAVNNNNNNNNNTNNNANSAAVNNNNNHNNSTNTTNNLATNGGGGPIIPIGNGPSVRGNGSGTPNSQLQQQHQQLPSPAQFYLQQNQVILLWKYL